jgi:hypothetical protein
MPDTPWMHERRDCPYTYCSAIMETVFVPIPPRSTDALPGQMQARRLMPRHDIENPLLNGPCPASLLDVQFFVNMPDPAMNSPMPPQTVRVLHERYIVDSRRLPQLIQNAEDHAYDQITRGYVEPESQSLRGSHRLGREPVTAEDQEDWSLGGRADEDIIPLGEERRGMVPATTQGTPMGRGTGMDVTESIGALQQGAMHGGSAWQAIAESRDTTMGALRELEEARSLARAVRGDTQSETLNAYIQVLSDAIAALELTLPHFDSAQRRITSGQEHGETYINSLLS